MARTPTSIELEALGLDRFTAKELAGALDQALVQAPALGGWPAVRAQLVPDLPPAVYVAVFDAVHEGIDAAAAWAPSADELMQSNLMELLCDHKTLAGIHRWSLNEPVAFRTWAEETRQCTTGADADLRAGVHAHVHLELRKGDSLAWAGPAGAPWEEWARRAGLWNGAPLVENLPDPQSRAFGVALSERRVSHLGVHPTVVQGWIASGCMAGVDWSALRCIVRPASIEAAAEEDGATGRSTALWLMARASWRPTVEVRMTGMEVQAAGSLVSAQVPGVCNSPAVGLRALF